MFSNNDVLLFEEIANAFEIFCCTAELVDFSEDVNTGHQLYVSGIQISYDTNTRHVHTSIQAMTKRASEYWTNLSCN